MSWLSRVPFADRLIHPVRYRSSCRNVYHICAHKTGSQWVRKILEDKRTYCYSGLRPYHYHSFLPGHSDSRTYYETSFVEPFPEKTIVTPIYTSYDNYKTMPRHESARALFVMRDPRDIVTSWYHSMMYSHALVGKTAERREYLNSVSLEEGLAWAIDTLADSGLFDAIGSWNRASPEDKTIIVLRYEDLIGPRQHELFRQVIDHCDIGMPDNVLADLLREYSFEALSGGRKAGEENIKSHFRKGIVGDWKNFLPDWALKQFGERTGDLIAELGYES